MPILHFHGHFRFHMPEYNNGPRNPGLVFDANAPAAAVVRACGCDPARYYEFEFFDVRISQATYAGAESATSGDAALGRELELSGFLPDVSASAICSQLYAGRLQIDGLMSGTVRKGIQSDLRLNIRPLGFTDETAGAHFATVVDVAEWEELGGSRAATELGGAKTLEIAFHLNHYTRQDNPASPDEARLTGDVYGYLRPSDPEAADGDPVRNRGRRVVAHPRLAEDRSLDATFLRNTGATPLMRISDIDGTYDLLPDDRALVLRPLDFVPLLDRDHATPTSAGIVDEYSVYFEGGGSEREIGRFRGDHEEMKRTGGLLAFPLPSDLGDLSGRRLAVAAVKDGSKHPIMGESEVDVVLESDRGLTLGSGDSVEVVARVFRDQRPSAGHLVRLRTQRSNPRSPIVASIEGTTATTDSSGRVRVNVRAIDLMNTGGLVDPVTGLQADSLPWDRYYGNYVYLAIDNPQRPTAPPLEEIEIAVRVLHKAPPVTGAPSFERDIRPLFSYYARYFPWLHTKRSGAGYARFLDVMDYDSVSDNAQEVVRRLELDEHRPEAMPRSRDFPVGGVARVKQWVESGMDE